MIHLTWIDKLLDNIKIVFVDLYRDQLKKPYTSVVECDFETYFDQQVRELEGSAANLEQQAPHVKIDQPNPNLDEKVEEDEPPAPVPGLAPERKRAPASTSTSADTTPIPTPDSSRPSTPRGVILTGKNAPKGASRRSRKAVSGVANGFPGEDHRSKTKKDTTKKMRKWDDDGMADEDDETILDYSAQSSDPIRESREGIFSMEPVDMQAAGTRNSKGQYVLKDVDEEVHSILQNATEKSLSPANSKAGVIGSSLGAITGMFRNVIGGKTLTKADLDKPMKAIEEHLLNKNVAHEAAVRLCEGVERELIGVKTGSFESVDASIRTAMASALQKILTPTNSLDILRSITTITTQQKRPYTISIVGVNGVGKSTNLSKLAFFLLQNNFSLLIAACDTFRSGAVEQLRVHARNLMELSEREGRGKVELYERGYGKDAANIAKDAISYANEKNFDVVLIDTAGRRHNDTRLMSSLEKFALLAKPDKILMVGEALVGSDSVAQARSFNAAFGAKRGLDGFIISKCDTVGEMVGALVSMVHATGIPVVFLGVGQHYGDLRTLSVQSTVSMLMS